MRKFSAIFLSVMFVLGLAASAFAIHAEIPAETQAVVAKGATQITLGGSIRVRGELKSNLSDAIDDENSAISTNDDHLTAYDQRVRLNVDAKVADNVQAYVELESSSCSSTSTDTDYTDDNGDTVTVTNTDRSCSPTSSSWTWGADDRGTSTYQESNAKPGELQILQAWINWKPQDNMNVKVGHMPLALGNKLFYDHTEFGDDAILVSVDPMEGTHVAALTIKIDEGSSSVSDDADAYVVLMNHKAGMFNVGADVTYLVDGSHGLATDGVKLWNIGLRGDVSPMENLTVRAEFDIQTGEIETATANGFCTSGKDCDFKGYAFLVGADFKLNNVTLSAEWAEGTGDESATDEDIDEYITSLSSTQYRTYVYDYRSVSAAGASTATSGNNNTGVANTRFLSLGATAKVNDSVTVMGKLYYLQAVEDVNMQRYLSGDSAGSKDDDLGFEFDGKVSVQLAKNLEYYVEGGILFTGDAYDGASEKADNMYAVRNGIQVAF